MRAHGIVLVGILAVLGACEGRPETKTETPPPPAAKAPKRTAVADHDLRLMLTDLAAEKACTMFRGVFRGLRDSKRPSVATGVLWIRGCKITRDGTKVVFRLSGDGWQWAEDKTEKAGATFAVAQDVRFSVEVTIPGALDLAYDPKTHVASILFTPSDTPEVEFTPRGGIEVDREGAWSSVLGALSTAIGDAPEEQASDQAESQGSREFTKSFADGLSFTLDLCTGYGRFGLGRPAQGKMAPPDVGESRAVDVELNPKGVLLFGPQPADKGYTARIKARGGAVRAELMCGSEAEKLALAYAERAERPTVKTLASKVIAGEGTIAIERASCPVVIVARSVAPTPVRLDWKRPPREIALGPLVPCDQ
jgi:hypothetical protein